MAERKVLVVTNITHCATEAGLSDLFSIAGNIARATIIQSEFPYHGFVEYFNAGDARRAINLNGKFFGSSQISVDYSPLPFPQQPLLTAPSKIPTFSEIDQYSQGFERNSQGDHYFNNQPIQEIQQTVQFNKPFISEEVTTEVLISNIPVMLKEHNLHQMFSEFGPVIDVSLVRDASGLATGRGKVAFTSLESASRAASSMNGKRLDGSYTPMGCTVKHNNNFNLNHSTGNGNQENIPDFRTNLPQRSTMRHHPYQNPNQMEPQFNGFSNMDHCMNQGKAQQFHKHFDGPPSPFGREANFGQPQQSTFNIHGGATHSLTASPNAPPQEQQPTAIYVGNLPDTSCKNCLLYQLFAPYGAITSVKAMESKVDSKEGKPASWFGFVNYTNLDAANVAVTTLDRSTLDGQVLKVMIKQDKPGFGKSQPRRSRFS